MPARFVDLDRQTPMFLPYDLREWLPAGHIVHFILDAVEQLPITDFRVNERGSGSEQYPPRMMLALLIYCYATGRFGSRTIEAASYSDVAVRYLCANHHPDLRPQKPHGRGVKPPTEPLSGRKTGPGAAKCDSDSFSLPPPFPLGCFSGLTHGYA